MESVKNIENLLDKYFEAETTSAEEQTLKAYFSQAKVAPHLQEYQPMFQYFTNAAQERYTKPVPLNPRKKHSYLKWISVAAVAVIAVGIYTNLPKQDAHKNQYGTYDDPELAYQETLKAFDLIAQNLNRGKEKVGYLAEFEETKTKILNNN